MEINIYNVANEKVGSMDVPENVFALPWNQALVHQVITSLASNTRRPWAHTKDRGDVSGGGRKPWRQKGTGRARAGSIRSPLWTGGGVTFGPRSERSYARKINKKMKQKALSTVLSKKLADGEIKVVDDFRIENGKTKTAMKMLEALCGKRSGRPSTLMIAHSGKRETVMAGRNIKKNSVIFSDSVNVYDCAINKNIVFEKTALAEFIGRAGKIGEKELTS